MLLFKLRKELFFISGNNKLKLRVKFFSAQVSASSAWPWCQGTICDRIFESFICPAADGLKEGCKSFLANLVCIHVYK